MRHRYMQIDGYIVAPAHTQAVINELRPFTCQDNNVLGLNRTLHTTLVDNIYCRQASNVEYKLKETARRMPCALETKLS